MFYLVKEKHKAIYRVVHAEIKDRRVWRNAWGADRHFEYHGVQEDDGDYFDTRDIIDRSKAKTKKNLLDKYPEYFL